MLLGLFNKKYHKMTMDVFVEFFPDLSLNRPPLYKQGNHEDVQNCEHKKANSETDATDKRQSAV